MSTLAGYTTHYKDPTYDRVNNPQRRPIAELLPIAVSWVDGRRPVQIDFSKNGVACPLADLSGVAIVESLFELNQNSAYVIDLDGSKRFVLARPSDAGSDAVFSDVFYVDGTLSFFLSGSDGDRRVECDAATGRILRVTQTR